MKIRIRCKYCGAKLKKDFIGYYCPTKNCDWQYGIPEEEIPSQNSLKCQIKTKKVKNEKD